MLTLYKTLVRSKLDYGCNAYNSSSGTTLKMLDSVQNAGLRIATGAFRSSPINSLNVDAGEPPLDLRRQQLDLIYFVKIISAISHPINELFPNRQILNQQQIDLTKRTPFTVRVSTLLLSLNIEIPILQETVIPSSFPWGFPSPKLCLSLSRLPKNNTPLYRYKYEFLRLQHKLGDADFIYTDGSKNYSGVGASIVCNDHQYLFSLSQICSSYTAEMVAINKSLNVFHPTKQKLVICTDSLSVLLSLRNIFSTNPLNQTIYYSLQSAIRNGISVFFAWVPGHCGIAGNELADRAAKMAIAEGIPYREVPVDDFIALIKHKIKLKWRQTWENVSNNKLREIRRNVSP
ncbi:uncharacterized protein [Halyomorpha halys]|uniref:uncharacterized protein n=1 Tax=Halyomorpha halys TaxID=286706 RepID=UPI0034D2BCB1